MQANSPSGILATKIPIAKTIHSSTSYLTTKKASKKNTTPKPIEMHAIMRTNLSN